MNTDISLCVATRVLLVDDEKGIRITLRKFLEGAGYQVSVAEDVAEALDVLADTDIDVVVSDVVLPGESGVSLLEHIQKISSGIQVIMMTGEPSVSTASAALRARAFDYLTKPVSKDAIMRAVGNAATLKTMYDDRLRLKEENIDYQNKLEKLVKERTQRLKEVVEKWKHAIEGTILAMAETVELRDPYTAGHQQRVANLSRAIAVEIDLPEDSIMGVYYASLIHDLGKISVPSEILSYPGELSDEAMGLIRRHPRSGCRACPRGSP